IPLNRNQHRHGLAEQLILGHVIDGPCVLDPVASDLRNDLGLPVIKLWPGGRMISGNDQSTPRAPGNFNRRVGSLDAIDPAQEDQWSILCYFRLKRESIEFHAVMNGIPFTAGCSSDSADV